MKNYVLGLKGEALGRRFNVRGVGKCFTSLIASRRLAHSYASIMPIMETGIKPRLADQWQQ